MVGTGGKVVLTVAVVGTGATLAYLLTRPKPAPGQLQATLAGPTSISSGAAATFTASATGGTPPYSYAFISSVAGTQSADGASYTISPTADGTIYCTVTDSANGTTTTNTVSYSVTGGGGQPTPTTVEVDYTGGIARLAPAHALVVSGETVLFTGSLSANNGANLTGQPIVMTVDGVVYDAGNVTTGANGAFSGSFPYSGSVGTHTLGASFAGETIGGVYYEPSSKTVTFTVTSATFTATFTESGLASGTSWTVTVGGTPYSATTSTITVAGLTGTVSYTVSVVSGYTITSGGSGTVTSSSPSASVVFALAATLSPPVVTPASLPSSGGTVSVEGATTLANGTAIGIYEQGNPNAVATTSVSGGKYGPVSVNVPANSGSNAVQYTIYAGGGGLTSTGVYIWVSGTAQQNVVTITIVTPTGCAISLGGNGYTNGDVAQVLGGNTYPLSATAGAGYTFTSFTLSGPFVLGSGGTTLVVSVVGTNATGTLQANFSGGSPPPTGYNVTVGSDGCSQVPVAVNGVATAGVVNLAPGTYSVQCAGNCQKVIGGTLYTYTFSGWVATGGVTVTGTGTSASMTVSGDGGLTAQYTFS